MDPESPNAASLEGRNEVMVLDPHQGQLAKATQQLVTLADKVKERMQNNATNMDVRTRMEVRSMLNQMISLQQFIRMELKPNNNESSDSSVSSHSSDISTQANSEDDSESEPMDYSSLYPSLELALFEPATCNGDRIEDPMPMENSIAVEVVSRPYPFGGDHPERGRMLHDFWAAVHRCFENPTQACLRITVTHDGWFRMKDVGEGLVAEVNKHGGKIIYDYPEDFLIERADGDSLIYIKAIHRMPV